MPIGVWGGVWGGTAQSVPTLGTWRLNVTLTPESCNGAERSIVAWTLYLTVLVPVVYLTVLVPVAIVKVWRGGLPTTLLRLAGLVNGDSYKKV